MLDFVINRKIKKLAAHKKGKKHFQDLNAIRSVFVLFESSGYSEAEWFINHLEKLGKNVSACGYVGKNDPDTYSQPFCRMIKDKIDVDRWKMPSESIIRELSAGSYDAVIDLTLENNKTIQYLLLTVDSPFKVGLRKNDAPLYDMTLSINHEDKDNPLTVRYLGEQILYYLQTIHSV